MSEFIKAITRESNKKIEERYAAAKKRFYEDWSMKDKTEKFEIGTKVKLLITTAFRSDSWTIIVPSGEIGQISRLKYFYPDSDATSEFTVMFVNKETGLICVSDTMREGIDFEVCDAT